MDSRPGQLGRPSAAGATGSAGRQLAGEAYRLLPLLAMAVAVVAVLVTVAQALLFRPEAASSAPAVSAPPASLQAASPAAATASEPPAGAADARSASSTPAATASAAPSAAADASLASASAIAVGAPTAAPVGTADTASGPAGPPASPASASVVPAAALPRAELRASWLGTTLVRMQGRVPDPGSDYWFLIRQPNSGGYFRQGPLHPAVDGTFVHDLSDLPVKSGPDVVTLAAIPRATSTAWLQEYTRIGTWLPVVTVQEGNGVAFLGQVTL